jgi:hypothetical protein
MLRESKSDVCMFLATKERRVNGANRSNVRLKYPTLPDGESKGEECLSHLVSHCPQ